MLLRGEVVARRLAMLAQHDIGRFVGALRHFRRRGYWAVPPGSRSAPPRRGSRRLQRRHLVAKRDSLGLQRYAVGAAALGLADLLGQGISPRLLVLQHLQRAASRGVLRQELLGHWRQAPPRHRRIERRRVGADRRISCMAVRSRNSGRGPALAAGPGKSGEGPRLRSSSSRPASSAPSTPPPGSTLVERQQRHREAIWLITSGGVSIAAKTNMPTMA